MNYHHFTSFSHRGHSRADNQDAVLVREGVGLAAVFDGCGGHPGGEVASTLAAQAVDAALARLSSVRPGDSATVALHQGALAGAFAAANRDVLHRAAGPRNPIGRMATTACAALFTTDRLTFGHVGDSRCYLLRGPELFQLTVDHCMREALLLAGATPESVAELDSRYLEMLVNVIGRDDCEPEVRTVRTEFGDVVLLCTDGVYREMAPRRIAEVLREGDPATALLAACLDTACHDNVSGVVVQIL